MIRLTKKRVGTTAVIALALIATMSAAPAHAEPEPQPADAQAQNDLTTTDLEVAPEGYWTPERMAAATVNSTTEIVANAAGTESRSAVSPLSFDVKPQRTIAWHTGPNPGPAPVVYGGINHPHTVGKLFMTKHIKGKAPKDDYCTATVVTSESESLIITAGHCVYPSDHERASSNMTFVPAYHGNEDDEAQFPLGEWDATSVITRGCWTISSDSTCDQAFVKIAPNNGETLQEVVGSAGLTIDGSPDRGGNTKTSPWKLTLHGYPEPDDRFPMFNPDPNRVYECVGTMSAADQNALFKGAVQMPCSEPIVGGASGAGFIQHSPGGRSVIGTFIGKTADAPTTLLGKMNDSTTESMYAELDAYSPE